MQNMLNKMKAVRNSSASPNGEIVTGLGQSGDPGPALLCHCPAPHHSCPSAKRG